MPLPLWDNLWLDCEDAFQRGDYASVVIWGHSAIETLSHATVLSWLHEQSVDVDKAAELVARNHSHIGKLKQCLSLEEIVENLNDTHKVEIALLKIMNADPSWGFDFCSRFARRANSAPTREPGVKPKIDQKPTTIEGRRSPCNQRLRGFARLV